MGMVSPKRTSTRPSSRVRRPTSPALDTASRPSSTTRVTPNTALRSGSSQQGKASRASVGSICVVPMTCSTGSVPSSVGVVKTLR